MRVLTIKEIREAEQEAAGQDVTTLGLMQRAGYVVAQFCLEQFKFESVCVVCGKGNNGGDGLVAAEALHEFGKKVSVIVLAKSPAELSRDAAHFCSELSVAPIWVSKESELHGKAVEEAFDAADLVVDAIVGTGFKPPLKGLAKKAVELINEFDYDVVAVDLPSGVDADDTSNEFEENEAVAADGVVTFIAPKPAHVFADLTSGAIAVHDLGIREPFVQDELNLNVTTGQEVMMVFPPRHADAHKGDFGHVLVIGGSMGKAGAAGLAGLAALQTGAGLVTIACPRSVQPTIAGFAPELMTEGLPETADGTISLEASEKLDHLLTGKDVIVLGPGISRNEETAEFVRQFVARCPLSLVLDADGLNAFEGHYGKLSSRGDSAPLLVLTPHPGEAARLTGLSIEQIQEQRMERAREIAQKTGACVVLKGRRTITVGLSSEVWLNMTGNPALAKGGSGDVLSGMIGATLARHQGGLGWMQGAEAVSEFEEVNALLGDLFESEPGIEKLETDELLPNFGRVSAALKVQKVAAAVYLHGLAGDLARDRSHENCIIARDLLQALGEVFNDCDRQMDHGLFYLQK
jgi:NAD(P)H-hydrate epimerase